MKKSLTNKEIPDSDDDIKISPFIKCMRINIPADFDDKKAYKDYFSEKYK